MVQYSVIQWSAQSLTTSKVATLHETCTQFLAYLLTGELIGSDALHERNSVGVELVRLIGLIHDGKRDAKAEPLQVTHLFGEGDCLRGKVHLEFE